MLLREKADQAEALLRETGLGCWLIFVRETDLHPDPGADLVLGTGVVRNSAFLFGAGGQRVAIAANFDTANIRAAGVFREVIGYDDDVRTPLLAALGRIDPASIGLNYSADDVTADGLTHGQWLLLNELLRGTSYAGRLTSAAPLRPRRGIEIGQRQWIPVVSAPITSSRHAQPSLHTFTKKSEKPLHSAGFIFQNTPDPAGTALEGRPAGEPGPLRDPYTTFPRPVGK